MKSATIAHIQDANAIAITGTVTFFLNVPLGLTGADIILVQELDKDWIVAGGYLKMFEIGALKQGVHKSVSSYWVKILKYEDQLGYTPAQKKTQFMSRVRDDIKEKIYRIGLPPLYLSYTPVPPAISNVMPQQQEISLADFQKAMQDALAQQKTEF
ncbi:hypothetical protein F8M41_005554 [Gigaspora margarita]|uniref:Uncharacterized protein n=1 Tax=Gigaspora margarita TaxID=4874 RepID=A0A8H3XAI9_GIGMA|nr:hypothetical protein F8M41_005554 [Gigaspora margarita]